MVDLIPSSFPPGSPGTTDLLLLQLHPHASLCWPFWSVTGGLEWSGLHGSFHSDSIIAPVFRMIAAGHLHAQDLEAAEPLVAECLDFHLLQPHSSLLCFHSPGGCTKSWLDHGIIAPCRSERCFYCQGPWGGCCPSILASPTSAPGRRRQGGGSLDHWRCLLWVGPCGQLSILSQPPCLRASPAACVMHVLSLSLEYPGTW